MIQDIVVRIKSEKVRLINKIVQNLLVICLIFVETVRIVLDFRKIKTTRYCGMEFINIFYNSVGDISKALRYCPSDYGASA